MPTPDDPHMVNVFLLAFGGLMGWLVSLAIARHGASASATPLRDRLLLAALSCAPVVVLLGNAAVARSARASWEARSVTPPLETLAGVEAAGNGAEVLVVGQAMPENDRAADGSPAYVVEYDHDGKRWPKGDSLRVALSGGTLRVVGVDRAADWNWRYERHIRSWLAAGDPVAVMGTIRQGVSLAGGDRGRRQVWVEAGVVYRGTHAAYVAAAHGQAGRVWPRTLGWASLMAAMAVGFLAVVAWARRRP